MGCCGGGNRSIRSSQIVSRERKSQPAPTIRKSADNKNAARPAPINRQYIVKQLSCPKCKYPTMLVHIAGRERHQCTNNSCRLVLQ